MSPSTAARDIPALVLHVVRLVEYENVAIDGYVHPLANERVNHVLVRSDHQVSVLSQLAGCIVGTHVFHVPKPLQVFYVVHLGPHASATELALQRDVHRANVCLAQAASQ